MKVIQLLLNITRVTDARQPGEIHSTALSSIERLYRKSIQPHNRNIETMLATRCFYLYMTNIIIGLLSAAFFLYYGFECLLSIKMKEEFARFGLDAQRKLTGVLQLLGAMGLIVGIAFSPEIGAMAAAGLSVLMLFGFAVRLKMRDDLMTSLPSFLFMFVNAYLSYRFYLLV